MLYAHGFSLILVFRSKMSSQVLFFLGALGAFNGLVLSVFLFLSKPRKTANLLLAALLLVISVRISKSIWFFYDPNLGKQFLQLGLSACFLIGPFLYSYAIKVVETESEKQHDWRKHIFPLLALLVLVGFIFPYQTNTQLWGIFYTVINLAWAVYLGITGYRLRNVFNHYIADKTKVSDEKKLCLHVYIGTLIIWLAYFTASYTSYIVGALSFSFIVYLSAIIWFVPKLQRVNSQDKKPYEGKKIEPQVVSVVERDLGELMEREKLFKDASLTLPKLAKRLQISPQQLSQILNDNIKYSFAQYVNKWRIDEAKKLLIQNKRMTMEQVAEQCGYNSQSTFYTSFKQFEHCTPAKFRTLSLKEKKSTSKL